MRLRCSCEARRERSDECQCRRSLTGISDLGKHPRRSRWFELPTPQRPPRRRTEEYFPEELHPRVLPPFTAAVRALEGLGAEVTQISLPSTRSALSAYYIISSAEASSNLARYDGVEYGFHTPPVPVITRTQRRGRPGSATRCANVSCSARLR